MQKAATQQSKSQPAEANQCCHECCFMPDKLAANVAASFRTTNSVHVQTDKLNSVSGVAAKAQMSGASPKGSKASAAVNEFMHTSFMSTTSCHITTIAAPSTDATALHEFGHHSAHSTRHCCMQQPILVWLGTAHSDWTATAQQDAQPAYQSHGDVLNITTTAVNNAIMKHCQKPVVSAAGRIRGNAHFSGSKTPHSVCKPIPNSTHFQMSPHWDLTASIQHHHKPFTISAGHIRGNAHFSSSDTLHCVCNLFSNSSSFQMPSQGERTAIIFCSSSGVIIRLSMFSQISHAASVFCNSSGMKGLPMFPQVDQNASILCNSSHMNRLLGRAGAASAYMLYKSCQDGSFQQVFGIGKNMQGGEQPCHLLLATIYVCAIHACLLNIGQVLDSRCHAGKPE